MVTLPRGATAGGRTKHTPPHAPHKHDSGQSLRAAVQTGQGGGKEGDRRLRRGGEHLCHQGSTQRSGWIQHTERRRPRYSSFPVTPIDVALFAHDGTHPPTSPTATDRNLSEHVRGQQAHFQDHSWHASKDLTSSPRNWTLKKRRSSPAPSFNP